MSYKISMNIRLITASGLLCFTLLSAANAQSSHQWRLLSGLHAGMQKGEVVALLGPAPIKHDYETRRMAAWEYPRGRLVFQEGTLLNWQGEQSAELESMAPSQSGGSPRVKVSPEAEALLSEILKEIPSDGDTASPSSAPAPTRQENPGGGNVALRPIPEDMKFRESPDGRD